MLIKDAKSKGISAISLEATDMGRPLYEKYGFVKMNNEVELLETSVGFSNESTGGKSQNL